MRVSTGWWECFPAHDDTDSSGAIDRAEFMAAQHTFAKAAEILGFEVDYTFEAVDLDSSGGVDFAEFYTALCPLQAGRSGNSSRLQALYGPKAFSSVVQKLVEEAARCSSMTREG